MTNDITISSAALTARVSDLGAELQALTHATGELLWHGDPAHWSGRSPILFPIVGRAPDDQVSVDGVAAPMGQHGFARRATWTLARHAEDSCTHMLTETPDSLAIYPRAFRLTLTHALSDATLSVTAEVTNTGDKPLPFGLGYHPAFNWPLPGADGAEHVLTLEGGAEPPLSYIGEGALLQPGRKPSPFAAGRLPLSYDLFDNDALILEEDWGDAITYAAPGSAAPTLSFRFSNCPALGIWTKRGAPFLCIEPWHGIAARAGGGYEIADRPLSLSLAPGDSAAFGWSVTVS